MMCSCSGLEKPNIIIITLYFLRVIYFFVQAAVTFVTTYISSPLLSFEWCACVRACLWCVLSTQCVQTVCAVFGVQFSVCGVQCIVCSVRYAVCIMQCRLLICNYVYIVQYALCCVQYTVWRV